jgi:hypothetical protein
MKKRGQAAMEFLMTYGWAILVVLIAIGALAYFGVLNPGRFLPSSCTITPGVSCEDFVVNYVDGTNDAITVTLRNGMGDDLTSATVTINEPDTGTAVCTLACSNGCTGDGSDTLPDGTLTTWTAATCIGGSGVGATGSKFKGDVVFGYTGAGGLAHSKTGSLTTQVE